MLSRTLFPKVLLGRSEADVVAHEQWFRELQRLDEERRKSIDEWRRQQEQVGGGVRGWKERRLPGV